MSREELLEKRLETWGDGESVWFKARGQQFSGEARTLFTAHNQNQSSNMLGRLLKAAKALFRYVRDFDRISLSDAEVNALASVVAGMFICHILN